MALLTRQIGTGSCMTLPATEVAVLVITNFANFGTQIDFEMLLKQTTATWGRDSGMKQLMFRLTSEGCLESPTRPSLVTCHQ